MRFLANETIEKIAEEFLCRYHPSGRIPVPVEEIITGEMKIRLVPVDGLKEQTGMDGSLSWDLRTIYIDERQYMRFAVRSRFTLAHELGHILLHERSIKDVVFASIDEWKKTMQEFSPGGVRMEYQAHRLAARLLIPQTSLSACYLELEAKLGSDRSWQGYPLAREVAKRFRVSQECAERRLADFLNGIRERGEGDEDQR